MHPILSLLMAAMVGLSIYVTQRRQERAAARDKDRPPPWQQPAGRPVPDDAADRVGAFIAWFEKERARDFAFVLQWIVLNQHVCQHLDASPMKDYDPLMDLFDDGIGMFMGWPSPRSVDQVQHLRALRDVVTRRLIDEGYPEDYFGCLPLPESPAMRREGDGGEGLRGQKGISSPS